MLFVVLNCCDKDLFCLSRWVTATNVFFVCCTESLRQTKLIYVTQKKEKMCQKFWIIQNRHNEYQKCTKSAKKGKSTMLALFGIFLDIQKKLSQWLIPTNKKSVCRSDSVRQTKQIFVAVYKDISWSNRTIPRIQQTIKPV